MRRSFSLSLSLLAIACITSCIPEVPNDPGKKLSVSLKETTITLPFETSVNVGYSYSDAERALSVSAKDLPDGISLTNEVTSLTEGKLSFISKIDSEKEYRVSLIFADKKNSVTKEIVLKTRKKETGSIKIISQLESNVIYPAECSIPLDIPFTIDCKSTIDEVTVETGSGLDASLNLASDKKSGTIKVTAKTNLGTTSNVILKARNSTTDASISFSLVKAFLYLSGYECNVPGTGTKQPYNFIVSTNLEYNVIIEIPARDYVTCSVQNNSVNFTVAENPKWEPRTAKITVSDKMNILSCEFVISQAITEGSNASDREALMAIYKSLNMKEWTDYGSFGTYYKNWGTDAPMDTWLGLDWSDYEGKGRCVYIHLVGVQPKSTGIIPEEIGHLTKLRELEIFPGHHITKLPDSIKNLVNLRELGFLDDELDMDLKDWAGFNELMNNPNCKLQGICFDGTKLHGSYPEWTTRFDKDGQLGITGCHFSGQIPDAVTKCEFWKKKYAYDANALEACPRFDKTKYKKSEDGWYYFVPQGEAMMFLQADNYALWVGERPSNTKWVNDKFGGHWEWTD